MTSIEFTETLYVASNRWYQFGIGKAGSRWLGFALGRGRRLRGLFVFSEISDGAELGVLDKNEAIRKTAALARDPGRRYGDIERWYIADELRGHPEEFRCGTCGEVLCDGFCSDLAADDWEKDG